MELLVITYTVRKIVRYSVHLSFATAIFRACRSIHTKAAQGGIRPVKHLSLTLSLNLIVSLAVYADFPVTAGSRNMFKDTTEHNQQHLDFGSSNAGLGKLLFILKNSQPYSFLHRL